MADQTISVNMDVAGVKAAAADFLAALDGQATGVTNLFQKMATLNKQGEVMRQVVTGIAADGSKLIATLDQTKKGWELVSLQVDRAAQAYDKLKKAQSVRDANAIENLVRGRNADQLNGLDLGQANQVESSIQRIKNAIVGGQIETKRLQELLDRLMRNPTEVISGLTAGEAKFVNAYRRMIQQLETFKQKQKDAADASERESKRQADAAVNEINRVTQALRNARAATQAEQQLRADFAAPNNIARLNQYEQAIAKIKQMLESGRISLQRFNELAAQVKANPKGTIQGLSGDEQKAVKALRDIAQSTDAAAEAGKRANSVWISMGGILRLLEAQILKRIFSTLEAEILGSVSAAQQLSIAIAEIQTISQRAGISTEEWHRNISELSNTFGATQADLAEAAYESLSNQVTKARDTFTFLEQAQKFAIATNSSTAQSVNLLSSAIKSFGLDAADTERVASVFFKTIDLGRVRAKDMSDSFGRIGVIAQEVGVRLEEVAAGVATLTVRGTKFADASTIMSNLLLKLIRPTDEMKKLFAEWGVATGDQAIATFGFVGVLQKLEQEAQKGTGRLGDLFNQIRALRGAFNFTGQGLTDFQSNLEKITGGQAEYQNAFKLVLESPGKQLQIEMQKIRTLFVDAFGTEVVKSLVQFRNGLKAVGIESFADGINKTANAAKIAAGAWLIYRGSLLTAAAGQAAFATTLTATGVASQSLLTSLGLIGVTLGGAIAVGVAAGVAFNWLYPAAKGAKELADQFDRIAAQKKFDALAQPNILKENIAIEAVGESTKTKLQAVLQFSATVNSKMTELKARAIQNQKDTTEALKLSSKAYFDSLNENIKKLNEKITESKNIIQQSRRLSEDIPRIAENRVFDTKLKFASEGTIDNGQLINEQKTILIQSKLQQTLQRAREEAAKGTKESIEESRKLFSDAEQLQAQLFEQQTANERRLFEDRVRRGLEQPSRTRSDGQQEFDFVARTADFNRQVNRLAEERLRVEEQIRKSKEAQILQDQEQLAIEKDRLRDLQAQFDKLEKLALFSKEGNLRPEFKGKDGQQKALAEFDTIASKIRELSAGENFQTQFQVFSDLMRQREALIKTVNVSQRQEDATTNNQAIINASKAAEKITADTKAALKGKTDAIVQSLVDLDQKLEIIEKRDLPSRNGPLGLITPEVRRAGPARQEAERQLALVKEARDAFAEDQSPEKALLLKQRIDQLNAAIARYVQLRTGRPADQVAIGSDTETIGARGQSVEKTGARLLETANEKGQIIKALDDAEQKSKALNEKIAAIPGLFDAAQIGVGEKAPGMIENFNQVSQSAANVVEQIRRLNEQINALNKELPALRAEGLAIPEAPGQMFGGKPKYMSYGGMVGFVPRGSDTRPAMLTRDEMVMTGGATRQFAPILEAMNNGFLNRNSQTNNNVTNVGDININYTASGGSTAQSVRELGTMLRRSVRRGTINLGK